MREDMQQNSLLSVTSQMTLYRNIQLCSTMTGNKLTFVGGEVFLLADGALRVWGFFCGLRLPFSAAAVIVLLKPVCQILDAARLVQT